MDTGVEMSNVPPSVVLALNNGSSSLKFGLYRVGPEDCETLLADKVEVSGAAGAVAAVKKLLDAHAGPSPEIVGHRIVHGGVKVRDHRTIDASVMAELEAAAVLAPLHAPPALAIVRYARAHFGDLPHVACVDTAFHACMPEVAQIYPLPRALRVEGLIRYGFHGLSCESIVRQLAADVPERLVIAHLGGGCSVTAVRAGRSIDTSMGLTPSGGVMMASRAGDLDPGLLIYLARAKGLDPDALEDLIDRRSGLLGVSGLSADLRVLRRSADPAAVLAIAMFEYSVRKQIAAMIAALGGADLLVFTGGIGEHDAATRTAVHEALAWAGIGAVRALESRENEMIARHAWMLAPRR